MSKLKVTAGGPPNLFHTYWVSEVDDYTEWATRREEQMKLRRLLEAAPKLLKACEEAKTFLAALWTMLDAGGYMRRDEDHINIAALNRLLEQLGASIKEADHEPA